MSQYTIFSMQDDAIRYAVSAVAALTVIAWVSNCIPAFNVDAITYPCHRSSVSLFNACLKRASWCCPDFRDLTIKHYGV